MRSPRPFFFPAARGLCILLLLVSATPARAARAVSVTILETTDLHANLLPWDYTRARTSDVGLARVATRISKIRAESPNVLLLDAGDTIQGTPVGYVQARREAFRDRLEREGAPDVDPMAQAMSLLRYDAMTVGNHDFNYGLEVLRKAERESSFPWLSANTRYAKDGSPAFREYVVKTVGGVKIGVLGLTTPNIPSWEPEANRPGLSWEDPVETAKRLVPVLRGKERCDYVIALIHSGPELDLATGAPDGTDAENRVAALARGVPGLDLLLTGHTHRRIPLQKLAGVPVIQPGRWGDVLARIDVTFTREKGRWKAGEPTGALLPSDASVAPDAAVAAIAAPFDRAVRAYLEEVVAESEESFPAERARLEDTPLLDFVNDTQRAATGADLSMTSLLPGGRYEGLPKGRITVRDLFALYPYDNQLVVLEIDGAALKGCLERAAEFYGEAVFRDGRLVLKPAERMIPYNFDAVQGASYRLDPTAPAGQRVRDLSVKGRPVKPSDRFTLAVNSYRAQGGGGYSSLRGARVVKVYPVEVRELLIRRLRETGHLAPAVDRNWVVAPDAVWAPPPAVRAPAPPPN